MTQSRLLIAGWLAIAAIALVATWSQNLAYFGSGGGLDVFVRFVLDTRVNPASRSITVDIGLFLLAAAVFMAVEARRVGVRFVWLYVLFGFLVAISVTFPLFMAARQLRLESGSRSDETPALTTSDWIGLAITAAAVAFLSVVILR